MSKGQTLRALVNERLAAAAEDIFVLFERTIAEYEEELCRSREENQRQQQLLETVLNQKTPSASHGSSTTLEIQETPLFIEKSEEQHIKQEEEQLPVSAPEASAVCVETEEFSLFQQRQTELTDETHGEDICSETFFHSDTEGHTDNDDWGPVLSYSATQTKTEDDGDHYNQVQIRDQSFTPSPQTQHAPETSIDSATLSGADSTERKKHQCLICQKRFSTKASLKTHARVHAGERHYRCTVCDKSFVDLSAMKQHKMLHFGATGFRCSICNKIFTNKYSLECHIRTHTGEKPYSCMMCEKTFSDQSTFKRHIRTHTGEKPFSCLVCQKTFTRRDNLKTHMNRAQHKLMSNGQESIIWENAPVSLFDPGTSE